MRHLTPHGDLAAAPSVMLVAAIVAFTVACSDGSTPTGPGPAPTPVANVSISPSNATMEPGVTMQLTATISDALGNALAGRRVAWRSSDETVAKLSASGDVTAIGVGSAIVVATSEGKSGTSMITVRASVASVSVSPSSATVAEAATVQLAAVVRDAASNVLDDRLVTWSSSNSTVASVSSSGLVSGAAVGSAVVTATSDGKSGTAVITVSPAEGGVPMTYLGTLGGTWSVATDVNDAGQVVGYSETASGADHAFLWTAAGGMTDLGAASGYSDSRAQGINVSGEIAGYVFDRPSGSLAVAFRWTAAGGMQLLPAPSTAYGINAAGQIVGCQSDRAFIWSASEGLKNIGVLPDQFFSSSSCAEGVNDAGQVVGASYYDDWETLWPRAFLWSVATGILDLGALGFTSEARAISNGGVVVGDGSAGAFVWTATDGMKALPGGSTARDVNDAGEIVGSSGWSAVQWTSARDVRVLYTPPAGRAGEATAINNHGAIVGVVSEPWGAAPRAVLWTIVSPSP